MVFAIVDAQGHYGDYTQVYRVFESIKQADGYAKAGRLAVIALDADVGEQVHRQDAARYERAADGLRRDQFRRRCEEHRTQLSSLLYQTDRAGWSGNESRIAGSRVVTRQELADLVALTRASESAFAARYGEEV